MTITEFLEARITEDEAIAQRAAKPGYFQVTGWCYWDNDYGGHLQVNDTGDVGMPARVLAECAAKRRIIADHDWLLGWGDATGDADCPHDGNVLPCPTLRILATIYADHPDYQPEWKI